jgi:hypothetical protein
MNLKINFIFLFLIISSSIYSQEKIEEGKYITSDKLKQIIIEDKFRFNYQAYKGYSPYTIKNKREKENKSKMCGTVAYINDGKGSGKYSIKNGKLILKFDLDISNIFEKKNRYKIFKRIMF